MTEIFKFDIGTESENLQVTEQKVTGDRHSYELIFDTSNFAKGSFELKVIQIKKSINFIIISNDSKRSEFDDIFKMRK